MTDEPERRSGGAALKVLLALVTAALCLYGMGDFGPSFWPMLVLALSLVLPASLFFPALHSPAVFVGRFLGVIAAIGLGLGLLAATVGGSFNVSPDIEYVYVGLAAMTVLGCAFFLLKVDSAPANGPGRG